MITCENGVYITAEVFSVRGESQYIRTDSGPEFIETAVYRWLAERKIEALDIEPS